MTMSDVDNAADAMVPWAAPNWAVVAVDDRLSAAVYAAMGNPVPDELAMDVPLLRFTTEGAPAMSLLEALLENPLPRYDDQICDRCGSSEWRCLDRLWIPCGASVVVIAMCWKCKSQAYDRAGFPSSLVWC